MDESGATEATAVDTTATSPFSRNSVKRTLVFDSSVDSSSIPHDHHNGSYGDEQMTEPPAISAAPPTASHLHQPTALTAPPSTAFTSQEDQTTRRIAELMRELQSDNYPTPVNKPQNIPVSSAQHQNTDHLNVSNSSSKRSSSPVSSAQRFQSSVWKQNTANGSSTGCTSEQKHLQELLEQETLRRKHCETQIRELHSKTLDLQQQLAVSSDSVRKKDEAIQQLDQTVNQLLTTWKTQEADRQERVTKTMRENEELNAAMASQQTVIDTFEKDFTEAIHQIEHLQEKIKRLEEELKTTNRKRVTETTDLQAELESQAKAHSSLKSERDDLLKLKNKLIKEKEKQCKEIEELNKRVEQQTNKLTKESSTEKKLLESETKKNKELRKEISTIQKTMENLDQEIEALKSERNALQNDMEFSASRHQADLQRTRAELEERHKVHSEELVAKIRDEHDEKMHREMEQHRLALNELQQKMNSQIQLQKHQFECERSSLLQKVKQSQAELDDTRAKLQKQVASYKQKLQSLESHSVQLSSSLRQLLEKNFQEALEIINKSVSQVSDLQSLNGDTTLSNASNVDPVSNQYFSNTSAHSSRTSSSSHGVYQPLNYSYSEETNGMYFKSRPKNMDSVSEYRISSQAQNGALSNGTSYHSQRQFFAQEEPSKNTSSGFIEESRTVTLQTQKFNSTPGVEFYSEEINNNATERALVQRENDQLKKGAKTQARVSTHVSSPRSTVPRSQAFETPGFLASSPNADRQFFGPGQSNAIIASDSQYTVAFLSEDSRTAAKDAGSPDSPADPLLNRILKNVDGRTPEGELSTTSTVSPLVEGHGQQLFKTPPEKQQRDDHSRSAAGDRPESQKDWSHDRSGDLEEKDRELQSYIQMLLNKPNNALNISNASSGGRGDHNHSAHSDSRYQDASQKPLVELHSPVKQPRSSTACHHPTNKKQAHPKPTDAAGRPWK